MSVENNKENDVEYKDENAENTEEEYVEYMKGAASDIIEVGKLIGGEGNSFGKLLLSYVN